MACYESCVDIGQRWSLPKHKICCLGCGGLRPHYNLISENNVKPIGEKPAGKTEEVEKKEEWVPYVLYNQCNCKQTCWQRILSLLGFGSKPPTCCTRLPLSVWDRGEIARAVLVGKVQELVQHIRSHTCNLQVRRTSQINIQEFLKEGEQALKVVDVSAHRKEYLEKYKGEHFVSESTASFDVDAYGEDRKRDKKHKRRKVKRRSIHGVNSAPKSSVDPRRSKLLSAIANFKARSKAVTLSESDSGSSSASSVKEHKDQSSKSLFNPFKNRSFIRNCSCPRKFRSLYCPLLPCVGQRISRPKGHRCSCKAIPESGLNKVGVLSRLNDQPSKKHRVCKQLQPLNRCTATSDKSPCSTQKSSEHPCKVKRSPCSTQKSSEHPCKVKRSPCSTQKSSEHPCKVKRSPCSTQKSSEHPYKVKRDHRVVQSSSMPCTTCTSCFGPKPFRSRFCRCDPDLTCGTPKLPCRSESFHSTLMRSPSPLAVVMPQISPCCRPCAVSTGRPRCRRFKCSCPLDCITRRSRSCSRPSCCCPIKSSYCSPPPLCKSRRERSSGPCVDTKSPCNLDCCHLGNKPPISICPPCCTKPCCLPCPRKFTVFPYCQRIDATSKRYLSIPPCTMRAACPCPVGGPCSCPKAKHFPLPCCPYSPSPTCRVACSTPSAISYIKSKQNDAICQRLLSKYGFSPPLCQNCPTPCYGNVAEGLCGNLAPSCTSNFYSCAGTGSGGCRSCLP